MSEKEVRGRFIIGSGWHPRHPIWGERSREPITWSAGTRSMWGKHWKEPIWRNTTPIWGALAGERFIVNLVKVIFKRVFRDKLFSSKGMVE